MNAKTNERLEDPSNWPTPFAPVQKSLREEYYRRKQRKRRSAMNIKRRTSNIEDRMNEKPMSGSKILPVGTLR
jgi:hypothetical protein